MEISNLIECLKLESEDSLNNSYKQFYQFITELHSYIHDQTHDIDHIIRVKNHVINALKEIDLHPNIKTCIKAAAIGHEIFDRKLIIYFPKDIDCDQMLEKCFNKYSFLIKTMIKLASTKDNLNYVNSDYPSYFYIPRDADRIESLGEIGIRRLLNYSIFKKQAFYNGKEPSLNSMEEIEEYIKNNEFAYLEDNKTMFNHIPDKLIYINVIGDNEYINEIYKKNRLIMCEYYINFSKFLLCYLK